jgi:GTP:adenosylcobinamide-phosphate guanylyltransferase
MKALVLAGGRATGLPVARKADLPVGDRRMVDHVAAALRAVPGVERVHVAEGSAEADLVDNLLKALREVGARPDEYVLISSCDIPFVTPEAIVDFLERGQGRADLYYPIVRREACEARFPGTRRTYVKLREGTFTGGNLFLLRAGSLEPVAEQLRRLFRQRKHPWRLARELGLWFTLTAALEAAMGTLSLPKLERRVERLTGLRGKAVVTDFAEIGTDIDKTDDLLLLEAFAERLSQTRKK